MNIDLAVLQLREIGDPGAIEAVFYLNLLKVWAALGLVAFVLLLKIPAPYGRFAPASPGRQRGVPSNIAWAIMESPAVVFFTLLYVLGSQKGMTATAFLLIWNAHYLYRTVLYPRLLRSRSRVPGYIVCCAVLFNLINAYLQAGFLFRIASPYPREWLVDSRFWIGGSLFASGLAVHIWTDRKLRQLREQGRAGYAIPNGGLFDLISCPNYFGEIIQWFGWAVLTWSAAGWVFAWWTFANLTPRALANHSWYREHFSDYPKSRKAILPFIV